MYTKEIEDILNDSNLLLTMRRRMIGDEIYFRLSNDDKDALSNIIAELIIRVNMMIKVSKENG